MNINIKSDFALLYQPAGTGGEPIDLRGIDFAVTVYTEGRDSEEYKVNGAACTFGGTGAVRIPVCGHSLGCGPVYLHLEAWLPDAAFPGGRRKFTDCRPTGVTLWHGPTEGAGAELHPDLPMAVVTAYETARAAGFAGTEAEYYAGLEVLPALSAAVSDFAAGKAAVARELRAKGADVADDAAMADMAAAVHGLRLAVEGEPGVVSQRWRGVGTDLLNALRNNLHPDYPYCWAASTPQPEVALTGADAYLCSDGFFTAESGTGHTFADAGTGAESWVIFYHSSPHYTVRNTVGLITGICVLNGTPDYDLADSEECVTAGPLLSYSTDTVTDGSPRIFRVTSPGITAVELAELITCSSASALGGRVSAGTFHMPRLEDAGGNLLFRDSPVARIYAPKLRKSLTSDPLLYKCPRLTHLELPALTESGRIGGEGTPLRLVRLPSLVKLSAAYALPTFIASNCEIHLDSWTGAGLPNNGALISGQRAHVYAPALGAATVGQFCSGTDNHLHLGTQQDAKISINGGNAHLHVAPGFRSSITAANTFGGTTRDELLEIIASLADNNGHDTHTLNFGADLLALLTDDEIALATAKNYTLS